MKNLISKRKKGGKVNHDAVVNERAERLEIMLVEREFFKHYSTTLIYIMFGLIFLSNVLINVDHGSLPGCSVSIKEEIGLDDF